MVEANGQPNQRMPSELARELARQGEVRLLAMMALATAADQRATTLAGIFGAGSVGVAAAVLAVLVSDHSSNSLIIGGAMVATGFFVAAIVAAKSGAPLAFYLAGADPDTLRDWSWTGTGWRGESETLEASAIRYAESISNNRNILKKNADLFIASFWIAFASPVFGAAIVLFMHFVAH